MTGDQVGEREGGTMPLYLSRFSYTPETWARLIGNPEDRRKAAQSYIESVGGKLHGFWYAFGEHDGYNLWEAPDNVSMAAVALAITGGGALRDCASFTARVDDVVPFRVEWVAGEVDGGELGVADLDALGVGALVEAGVDGQGGAGGGGGDQVDDRLAGEQGLAAPVDADLAEQAVLDLVPLAGAGREVADPDREASLVGQALQLGLPEAGAVAVGAAA